MPTAQVNGADLYYESHGQSEPLLFILGLGGHVAEVPYLAQAYGRHMRFILYDKSGCGRSKMPAAEFTIAELADEAAGLLDALGIESTFVYGSSMGGMIAQELALRHPRRVRALVLGCTTPSALRGVLPNPETVAAMIKNQSLSGDEAIVAGWKLGYSQPYIDAHYDEMLARSRDAGRYATPSDSYLRQVVAAAKHDTMDRLPAVTCPVMVIHGTDDVMIPPENAELLTKLIPHAELHLLDGMGHGYNLEAQEMADALVLDFVRRCASDVEVAGPAHAIR
jgi:pimeloyl-ACP methyl ester carboxylesterase